LPLSPVRRGEGLFASRGAGRLPGVSKRPPDRELRQAVTAASRLLKGRVDFVWGDFQVIIAAATGRDLVYMNPPYQDATYGSGPSAFLERLAVSGHPRCTGTPESHGPNPDIAKLHRIGAAGRQGGRPVDSVQLLSS
jgi:hypothetical protein